MADYTIKRLEDVQDVLGDYPGEMRMMTGDLEAEQVAFTYRRMPQHTGGKGSYGHRHKEQEEVYFVASGKLQFKLNDEIFDLESGTAVRVPPETWRSVWNDEPVEAVLIIVSKVVPGGSRDDAEYLENFWPEGGSQARAQAASASRRDRSSSPSVVRRYSTCGGLASRTSRRRTPALSSSPRRCARVAGGIEPSAWRNSVNRVQPWCDAYRIETA